MPGKSTGSGEGLITLRAREWSLAGVRAYVFSQVRSFRERAAAVPTLEGPVNIVNGSNMPS